MSGGEKRRLGRPPAREPTAAQQPILDFIRHFSAEHGFPPSMPEVATGVGRSYSAVKEQLDRLVRMGYLTRQPNVARSLQLTEKAARSRPGGRRERRRSERSLFVPLVGRAPAGEPLLADENVLEEVIVPYAVLRRDEEGFLVRAQGDSMLPEIKDGDLVVVRHQAEAEHGQIVVARCGEDEGTSDVCIKLLHRQNGELRLVSLNPDYPDVTTPFVELLGVVVGLIRPLR